MSSAESSVPQRQIRAVHDDTTITVYQAYSPAIADSALAAGQFVPPFKRDRMTWIKPSLLWMAYRSGWATKPGQERALAIKIRRAGFEWALEHSCLSQFETGVYPDHETWTANKSTSSVRVQWDPERDLHHRALDHRSIQIGLGGDTVDHYVDDWTVSITDITELLHRAHVHVNAGQLDEARKLLPDETVYPLPSRVAALVGATT